MATHTRRGTKNKAHTAPPPLSKDNNTVMNTSESLQIFITPSQQAATAHKLVSDIDLDDGFETVNIQDFFSYPVIILETTLNPTQARVSFLSHDPTKADYKIAFAGNLSLTDFI